MGTEKVCWMMGLLLAVYVWMRGPVNFISSDTGNNFSWKYKDRDEVIEFVVAQRKHKAVLSRWLGTGRVNYTYLVQVTRLRNDVQVGVFISSYGQLCSRLFISTTYPHRCVIAACVRELSV